MELKIIKTQWLDPNKPNEDYCLHGSIELKIKDKLVIDSKKLYTLSTTGLYLLRCLKYNYLGNSDWGNFFFPCCGFSMFENTSDENINYSFLVIISGCPNGEDIKIEHKDEIIKISYKNEYEEIHYSEFENIVYNFTNIIEEKYKSTLKDEIIDKVDKLGYELFWEEWELRKKDIHPTTASS